MNTDSNPSTAGLKVQVPQNQVQQNEISHVFSTENQTQDINSNMPNNSETRVDRREQQIHEQSQQNSQQFQQPGAFRIYRSYLNSSRVEETKEDITERPYPEVRVLAELVEDREADAIVVPTVNMGCGIVVSKPALQAFGIGMTTLVIICIAIAIIVVAPTETSVPPKNTSQSNCVGPCKELWNNKTHCCSYDYKNCDPSGDVWCSDNLSRCQVNCNGLWIQKGSKSSCIAKWGTCTSATTQCCSPATCQTVSWGKQCL